MKPILRYYQEEAIEAIYDYFRHEVGNPVVDLPTGSGKSVVIAGFAHRALEEYPDTTMLVLAHRKELLRQNAEKLELFMPHRRIGVWSSGLRKKDRQQVTVAGIQSVHKHADKFGAVDLVLVDECHLIGSGDGTMYRRLLEDAGRRDLLEAS